MYIKKSNIGPDDYSKTRKNYISPDDSSKRQKNSPKNLRLVKFAPSLEERPQNSKLKSIRKLVQKSWKNEMWKSENCSDTRIILVRTLRPSVLKFLSHFFHISSSTTSFLFIPFFNLNFFVDFFFPSFTPHNFFFFSFSFHKKI